MIRPTFRKAHDHRHLWPAQNGRPMAEQSIYDRIRLTTAHLCGQALSPHDFRRLDPL